MQPTLERTLAELHQQLEAAEDLGVEQTDMLRRTLAEIQEKLNANQGASLSLSEQLTASVEQFQGSHPALTNTIARVADLLAQMGI